MLKTKDNVAPILGEVKTMLAKKVPDDVNIGVKITKNALGGDNFEVYLNRRKIYHTLSNRKQVLGSVKTTFDSLMKTLMRGIVFISSKKDDVYKSCLGSEKNRKQQLLEGGEKEMIKLAQEIQTKIPLLKSEIKFKNEERASELYNNLDSAMEHIDEIIDEIIAIKAVEEMKARRDEK